MLEGVRPSSDLMADAKPPEATDEVAAVAEQVAAGKDAIRVPKDLVEEKPPGAKPPPAPDKALWAQIRDMSMAERIKLALKGNKEARTLLLRDTNPQIQRLVLQNPRITEEEILMVAKDRNTDEDILATLADSRDWTKIYALRVALVENARTPVAKALRLLATLGEKELSRLAKSKSVPNIVAVQSRRMLSQMRDRRG
jgi:hypothetical protein